VMHKFHLGQMVAYHPQKGIWAARSAYIVTAKLPEREGEFEYRIRSALEEHERLVRESELSPIKTDDNASGGKAKR
jgi:hypothetical protein